ncbi:cytochrome P450 [Cercophora scortea]|uniref:Cytochrome P450 n=1 Tax=Cercophora scortea TaxID=314031 RepID=A0AAE0I967_9PEZI|nr:cytochrome P450 [Cercophora scortea]
MASFTGTSTLDVLWNDVSSSPNKYLTLLALSALVFFVRWAATPNVDSREPPLIKPAIPGVGHIINLLMRQVDFYPYVFHVLTSKAYSREKKHLAMTIPLADKKMYLLKSPRLIQAAMRSKSLSFEPFLLEYSQNLLGMTDDEFAPVPKSVPDLIQAVHSSMASKHLHAMNATALNYIADEINAIGSFSLPSLDVNNAWIWIRTLITKATTNAMFGHRNPFHFNPSLVDDLWAFDNGTFFLGTNLFPRIFRPRSVAARARLQAALQKYYAARLDEGPDVSQIMRARAAVLRAHGVPNSSVGRFEIPMVQVGIVNTMPIMFWFFARVVSRPEVLARARTELLPLVEESLAPAPDSSNSMRQATVNISVLGDRAPFLVSCFRETNRLYNHAVIVRRVMADTQLSDDDENSTTYLLKKGTDVHMPANVVHRLPEAWGPDADEFQPERFLGGGATGTEADRMRKAATIPFGGGLHLCPGRNFAFAENMGLMAALVVGYDVRGLGDGPGLAPVPRAATVGLGHAIATPMGGGVGLRVSITRRQGWEDVEWRFTSS